MQMNPEVKSAKDLINPKFFDVVIEGVKAFFVFIDDLQEFEIPSLARKMGHGLKKMAEILGAESIKSSNKEKMAAFE